MAVMTIPAGCERQPDENEGVNATGEKTYSYILKGPYASLQGLFSGNSPELKKGTEVISGWIAQSWVLARRPGDCGVLSVTCVPKDTEEGGGGTSTQTPLKDIWQLRSCRNDVSILAYCGPNAANPQRELVEAWMKEPDGILAKDNKFTQADGTVYAITESPTLALMAKIRKGIEAVMRFYPMVVRTRVYSQSPTDSFSNLGKKDTPGWNSKPSGYDWLKCQDDLTEDTSGQWQRVEAWMGTPSSPGWDSNLYGPNAWAMPYQG